MANAIVNRQVNIYISSGEAQKALDKLIAKEKILKDELAKATDPKRVAALNTELKKLAEPIDRATKKVKNELTPSFRDLAAAAARAIAEFKKTGDPAMLAQYQKFNAALQQQKNLINGIDNAQKGLTTKGIFSASFWANLAAGGIQAAASAFSQFFSTARQEALDADRSTTQLRSTLENLGRADVFDRMIRKAQELADKFKFIDNDEITAVFRKLIDYGKLTEKEMNDLLPVIIDFATKQRISLEEASDTIVKALEGNGKALKTYGIDIKDAGTETERLNIIMTTLKGKVDGAAEAFGKSMAGQAAIARQEMNNMAEDIGNELIPILNKLGNVALNIVRNLKTFGKAVREVIEGGTGFFAINKDAIEKDPNFAATVDQLTEQRIAAFDAVQKNIEQQLGRKLTKSKADQDILQHSQDLVLQGFLNSAKSAQAKIEELKKDMRNNSDDGQTLRTALETSEASLRAIDTINANRNKGTLGISQPTVPDTKEADKKRQQEIDAYKAFLKKINELNEDFDINQQEGFEKDLAQLQKKIASLNEEAAKFKNNKDLLLRIEELYRKESLALIDKYTKLDQDKFDAAAQEQAKRLAAVLQKRLEALTVIANTTDRDKAAKDQLAILNSSGDEKIKLQKLQIQKEADAEVEEEIKKLTRLGATRENAENMLQNVIALIRQKAREKEDELDVDNIAGKIQRILPFAQQALDILNMIGDARTQKENAELEADRIRNDKKKKNLDRQLQGKVISQLQYQRELQKIEKEQEKREKEIHIKQFKRQQRADLAQAAINGAIAITSTLAAKPGPTDILTFGTLRAIQIGLVIAATAAQVASIAGRKPPEFAKGGKLGGRSHADGGNPILDGSGRKIAEIEAGEGIVNKRSMSDGRKYTVSGTPSQIASSINRLHGGVGWESGATISPAWRTYSPQRMNFSAMKRAYADGGVFGAPSNNQISTADSNEMKMLIAMNTQAIIELREQMKKPTKNYVKITDVEDAQVRIDTIRSEATIKA